MSNRRRSEGALRAAMASLKDARDESFSDEQRIYYLGECLGHVCAALGEQPEEPIDQAHWNKLLEASNEEWEAETTRLRGEIATLLQDKRDLRQLLHEILLLRDSALHSKGWIYINSSMRNNIESALAGEAKKGTT